MGASSFERRLGEVERKIVSWLRQSRKAAQRELHSGHGAKNAFSIFCCEFAVVRWGHECSECNGIAGVELPEEVEKALALVRVGWIGHREVLNKGLLFSLRRA